MHRVTALCLAAALAAGSAAAQGALPVVPAITPFMRELAGAASLDPAVAAFYRDNGYDAIWTDPEADDRARLSALIVAFGETDLHALPAGRFTEEGVRERLATVRTEADRAHAEAELSRTYLAYAHAVQSGILESNKVSSAVKRTPPRRDGAMLLTRIVDEEPGAVMRSLPPATPNYAALMRARLDLGRALAAGGWGAPVPEGRYEAGSSGAGVVALRDRLMAMGYLRRSATDVFDEAMDAAVRDFQDDHGLGVDGVAGGATLREMNRSAEDRLGQVVVEMERERWVNFDRGERHIWVNLADFTAKIIDHGNVTFQTRVVVGSAEGDQQSLEFSDEMDHLVVNPSWHVPRSIAVNEYLPAFKRNPHSNRQLNILYRGEVVSRERINWAVVNASNFPFELKQPPSQSNALGLVKFMFPNAWNIYLHDTPSKDLFDRSVRTFSHGCIRVEKPFDLAYELLASQTDDPQGYFKARLDTGRETRVNLEEHIPVHLVYHTAFATPKGRIVYRPDVYDRDVKVLDALEAAGVAILALPS